MVCHGRLPRTLWIIALMVLFSISVVGQSDSSFLSRNDGVDNELMVATNLKSFPEEKVDPKIIQVDEVAVQVASGRTPNVDPPQAEVKADTSQQIENTMEKQPVAQERVQIQPSEVKPVEVKPAEERQTIHVHTVQSGETLSVIASNYGISVNTIIQANEIRDVNRIGVGQKLQILNVEGVLHTVVPGESLSELASRYRVPINEIARANRISDPSRIQPQAKIVIPGANRLMPRDVLIVNGQLQRAFDWPTSGRISSAFGSRTHPVTGQRSSWHSGIDIAVSSGTPIRAAADGRVVLSGRNGGYGIMVIIDHGNGVETRYAHNSRNAVQVGQQVERGQVISYSGQTGVATGPHLHFEIRLRGQAFDATKYLR